MVRVLAVQAVIQAVLLAGMLAGAAYYFFFAGW